MNRGAAPILVTGLPRSGTTWLARQLSRAPGLALAGREPMNPRAGQFALGGTLTAWTRLGEQATPGQRRTLRRVYRGLEPRVLGRYGSRQWSAALPGVRVVAKDPFALLSLPLLVEVTGARPVILFRHPGAMWASYRRMGWTPAMDEIAALSLHPSALVPARPPQEADDDGILAMAWFWSTCYRTVLDDSAGLPSALVVDHAELTRGGERALTRLMLACEIPEGGLRRETPVAARARTGRAARGTAEQPVLHNFAKTAAELTEGWRDLMPVARAAHLEELTRQTWSMLRRRRLDLGDADVDRDDTGAALPTGVET